MKLLVIVLFLFATPVFAAPAKKCPPRCKHRTQHQCQPDTVYVSRETSKTLGQSLLNGLELQAGWRWQTERTCPTIRQPNPPVVSEDPFFIGLGLTAPLNSTVALRADWQWDVTHREWAGDKTPWQSHVLVVVTPFK